LRRLPVNFSIERPAASAADFPHKFVKSLKKADGFDFLTDQTKFISNLKFQISDQFEQGSIIRVFTRTDKNSFLRRFKT
jgi:hypothetical protein